MELGGGEGAPPEEVGGRYLHLPRPRKEGPAHLGDVPAPAAGRRAFDVGRARRGRAGESTRDRLSWNGKELGETRCAAARARGAAVGRAARILRARARGVAPSVLPARQAAALLLE